MISQVYDILKVWRERLPNVDSVTVILFEDELRLRVDFHPVGDLKMYYTQHFSKAQLDHLHEFTGLEDFVFNKIENEYKRFEVGEE